MTSCRLLAKWNLGKSRATTTYWKNTIQSRKYRSLVNIFYQCIYYYNITTIQMERKKCVQMKVFCCQPWDCEIGKERNNNNTPRVNNARTCYSWKRAGEKPHFDFWLSSIFTTDRCSYIHTPFARSLYRTHGVDECTISSAARIYKRGLRGAL